MNIILCVKKFLKRLSVSRDSHIGLIRGEGVVIEKDVILANPQNIVLEDYTFVGEGTRIYAQGKVHIKRGAIIADHCDIRTANHYYDGLDLNMLPFDEKILVKPVVIGANSWIASNVLIMPGITIGDGAVVAGGSVVTRDVECCEIVGGAPARHLKYRDRNRYLQLVKNDKIFMKSYKTAPRKIIME